MLRDFKISFYINSHADTDNLFITVDIVMQRDDGRGMAVRGNDDGW
jgi:hypothetical protein